MTRPARLGEPARRVVAAREFDRDDRARPGELAADESLGVLARQARVAHRRPRGAPAAAPRVPAAVACCARTRTGRVRMPRCRRYAPMGCSSPPVSARTGAGARPTRSVRRRRRPSRRRVRRGTSWRCAARASRRARSDAGARGRERVVDEDGHAPRGIRHPPQVDELEGRVRGGLDDRRARCPGRMAPAMPSTSVHVTSVPSRPLSSTWSVPP